MRFVFIPFALVAVTCASCSDASAPSDTSTALIGTWNYDQPDFVSGANVAKLDCPAGGGAPAFAAAIPQIGDITFERSGTLLRGTTDQGCSWTFRAGESGAELDPPAQTCFNKVIGSSYTITQWSLGVSGTSATEVLVATSHQASDCSFRIDAGRRHKVDPNDVSDPTTAFVGSWKYAPPTPTGTNVATLACKDQPPAYAPQGGALTIAKAGAHELTVTNDASCSWSFHVAGNTAKLTPGAPACAGGVAPTFWTMATNGKELVQIVSGTQQGCAFVLTDGRLVR